MGCSSAQTQKPRYADPGNATERLEAETFDPAYVGETLLVMAFLGVAVIIIALPFAAYGAYSGSMRWVITLVLVTVAALAGLRALYPLGAKAPYEPEPETFSRGDRDRFEALDEMAERAGQGYSYSQRAMNERMADAFLEKLRILRGLDPGEVFRLSENEGTLAEVCGDAEIASFVVRSKSAMADPDKRKRFTSRRAMLGRGARFNSQASKMIGRIESWEG